MNLRMLGGVKKTVKSMLKPEEKIANLQKKLAFCEREPESGEVEAVMENVGRCMELWQKLHKEPDTFVRDRLHNMSLEGLHQLQDLGSIRCDKTLIQVRTKTKQLSLIANLF